MHPPVRHVISSGSAADTSRVKRILREPLFHFLLLGGILFAASAWRDGSAPSEEQTNRIEVTPAVIDRLRVGYERQFGTAPDADELRDPGL